MGKKRGMTEKRWLTDAFVASLLYCLRGRGESSQRKFRLLAAACCRRAWAHLVDGRSRAAVEVAERHADSLADAEELARAGGEAVTALDEVCAARGYDMRDVLRKAPACFPRDAPATVRWASAAAYIATEDAERAAWAAEGVANTKELAADRGLLRCVFGNPFRPQRPPDPAVLAWGDGTVALLARAIYDDRAFDCLPVLADALEDAGCDDATVLLHCRQPGEHARGCWVLDLLLGKE
jgi:hypothetical protein